MKYYFPNMPNRLEPSSPYFDELDSNTEWIAEVKKNGWRCLVVKEKELTLWTRHKTTVNDTDLKELKGQLNRIIPDNTIVDAELIHFRTKGDKRRIYIFDVIMVKGNLVNNLPLRERRKILEKMFSNVPDCIELSRWVEVGKKNLYSQSINDDLNEGIVLKKLDSKYLISDKKCLDNPFWIKVKKVEDHIYLKSKKLGKI